MTETRDPALFFRTGNSARSTLAGSILSNESGGRFEDPSAGRRPKGAVDPHALTDLDALGYRARGFASTSRDVETEADVPHKDLIFSVCKSAAVNACPAWTGPPMAAPWGVEDPAAVEASEVSIQQNVAQAARFLKTGIVTVIQLSLAPLNRLALQTGRCQISTMVRSMKPEGKPT
jgi:arsenate reductase